MATVSLPSYNPVPSGVAGSGEAFMLGDAGRPLGVLMKVDALRQHQQQVEAQQRAKRDQEDLRNMTQNIKLDTTGFLPFKQELDNERESVYSGLLDDYNSNKTPAQRFVDARRRIDNHAAAVAFSNQIEGRVKTAVAAAKDPRYNDGAVLAAINKTFRNDKSPTGYVRLRDYNPDTIEQQLSNPDTFNRNKVVEQWLDDTLKKDEAATAQAASLGRVGKGNSITTNIWVPDPATGGKMFDPKTNRPIPRTELPEVVRAADNDPFMKALLDQMQGQYEAKVEAVRQKAATGQPLTDEDYAVMADEEKGGKTRSQLLTELVVPHGFNRQVHTETQAVRPRVGRAASGSTKGPGVGPAGGFTVEGATSSTGDYALPTPYSGGEPYTESASGERKPVVLKGSVFSNFNLQVPGKPLQRIANNTEAQDLVLKAPKLALVDKNGAMYFPSRPEVAQSQQATEQWMVDALNKPEAKQRGYRLTYVVQATPAKGLNNMGSVEEVFRSLKQSYEQPVSNDPQKQQIQQQMQQMGFGTTGRAKPSDAELYDKARQLYAKQSGTYYLPYEGGSKAKLDAATPMYRQQEPQMREALNRVMARVKAVRPAASSGGSIYSRPQDAASAVEATQPARANRGGSIYTQPSSASGRGPLADLMQRRGKSQLQTPSGNRFR